MANVSSVLVIILLVAAVYSRKDSELGKRTIGPVSPAYPGDPRDTPPSCYTDFFLGGLPPTDFEYDIPRGGLRYICQTADGYPGTFFYASLFNEATGIPVFSAYIVTGADAARIRSRSRCSSDVWQETPGIRKQGSDDLYSGSSSQDIARGHLNPCNINGYSSGHVLATFWYTNAVPQYGRASNSASWKRYERKIKEYVTDDCGSDGIMYLITGASKYRVNVTSDEPSRELGAERVVNYFPDSSDPGRIVRPNSLWTAGCCVNQSDGRVKWSVAVMGNNSSNKRKAEARPMSVGLLEELLVSDRASRPANLFPGNRRCRDPRKHHPHWDALQRTVRGLSSSL